MNIWNIREERKLEKKNDNNNNKETKQNIKENLFHNGVQIYLIFHSFNTNKLL